LIPQQERDQLRRRVEQLAPDATWVEMRHRPTQLLAADGQTESLAALEDAAVSAFCGIGNPLGFRRTLERCGCRIADFREFPDHHAYTRGDIDALSRWAGAQPGVSRIVCTHKDLVKIGETSLGPAPLWALTIGMEILAGADPLEAHLGRYVPETPGAITSSKGPSS
jgi:tetraacyldisaccharide 4'-kinase